MRWSRRSWRRPRSRAHERGRRGAFDAYERAMQRRFLAKDAVSWLVQAFLGRPVPVRLRRPAGRRASDGSCDDGSRDGRPRPGRPRARSAVPGCAARAMTGPRRTRVGAYAICPRRRRPDPAVPHRASVAPGEIWTLPGGGLEFGERPEVAVLRELPRRAATRARSSRWPTSRIGCSRVRSRAGAGCTRSGSSTASGSSVATLRDEVDGSTDTCAWFTPEAAARLTSRACPAGAPVDRGRPRRRCALGGRGAPAADPAG